MTCERCGSPADHSTPTCCSSHDKVLCHKRYRRTHFVGVCGCALCQSRGAEMTQPLGAAMPDSTLPGVTGPVTPAGSVATGMDEDAYHAHPALSVSGAKMLLPPSCPALFHYRQTHPRPNKRAFDVGHAAHKLVLGIGAPICPIDADDYRTKDARAQRDEAYAAGQVPVLFSEYAEIEAMAAAIKAHPIASRLLRPGTGIPEASLFWTDKESGVRCRGRLDWLPTEKRGGRLIIPDVKTAASADPETFAKSAANYHYAMQAAAYMDAVTACGLDDQPSFVFLVVEKSAPYLVTVVELDADAIRIGRALHRKAIRIFKTCTETGTWPGYSEGVELVSLPIWFQRQHEDITA